MKKQCSMIASVLAAALTAGAAYASPTCTLDSYTITQSAPAGQALQPLPLNTVISATKCYGTVELVPGQNPASVQPDINLGYLGDGLLNGEGNILPWTTFITSTQLVDLDPNSEGKVDPGWIQLGTMNGSTAPMTYSDIGAGPSALNTSEILNFTQTRDPNTGKIISGTWTLTLDANIINILHDNGLFTRNNFDQLAFVVKASNSWAVYDFDFTQLTGFDLTKPYSLSGTWNLDDFQNKKGVDQELSFLGVWARDPSIDPTNVAEPGALALFGVGMLALAGLRRRRSV